MAQAARILARVFVAVEPLLEPGITTAELDSVAEKAIRDGGGKPAFKGYRGFTGSICASVNEEVVHGIPGPRKLKQGDLISVDVGVELDGYFADAARTWSVGPAEESKQRLIEAARKSFEAGLAAYRPGCRIGDLSAAIQESIESGGYQVVRDFVGHGIGRQLHEEPQVPNYGKRGQGPRIVPGLVLALEPMVTEGHYAVETLADGWTVVTKDRKLASHYEDTVAFTEEGLINLTAAGETAARN